MTIQQTGVAPEDEGDRLTAAVSIESSLAGLRATQMECLRDFLLAYVAEAEVVALSGRERMVRYGGAGTPEVPVGAPPSR